MRLHAQIVRVTAASAAIALGAAALLTPTAATATPLHPDSAILVYDGGAGQIVEVAADGTQSVFASGLSTNYYHQGLAADGAGNVYATDDDSIVRFAPTGGSPTTVLSVPGAQFTDVGVDTAGDVSAWDASSSSLVRRLAVSGQVDTIAVNGWVGLTMNPSGTTYVANPFAVWSVPIGSTTVSSVPIVNPLLFMRALAVAPDGELWSGGDQILHLTTSGASTSLPTGGISEGIGFDADGNLYYAMGGPTVSEVPAGTTTPVDVATGFTNAMDVLQVPVVPAVTTPVPVPTTPTPTTTVPVTVAVSKDHPSSRRLEVSVGGFDSGEAYVVKLGKRTLATGTASSSGTITDDVRVPQCLGGTHRIRVVGAAGHVGRDAFHVDRTARHRCTKLYN
ncbi:hypothetical protein D9V37_05290 [Nocardioides mangrovicus]|uniref:Uncharacterized protein n=1 Tax=Nocardioides mangrovicus TaxID=2478913 RepID=A0A3L8P6D4_9ACTN|nr:hypothetical protein [Nocardioides mangrovicus]RLV50263.1 hypothetical protein D9V37_05290 [Nocardioides mangrovicus]